MKKRIIIAGANGFLGQALIEHLHSNYELIGLVRKEQPNAFCVSYCRWDGRTLGPWKDKFDGAYAVINLAGRSVDCRYNEKNKAQILSSRIESTRVLAEAIQSCKNPPQVWLNSASATIYEHSLDQPNGESSESIGSGFSVDVCLAWEKEFYRTELILRKVALRTTLVLVRREGFIPCSENSPCLAWEEPKGREIKW